jgi:hypothetical protein
VLHIYYTLTNSTLAIILEGSEQILALRAKIRIEKVDITAMKWYEVFSDWSDLLIRMPGSYLPYWVMAGSYWTEEGWDFVFAKKPQGLLKPILYKVLVITTSKDRYRRIIFETTKQNAQEITSWWLDK